MLSITVSGPVWMRARWEIRARRRSLLSAAVICGLFGGIGLATLAGARRTTATYPRFLERQRAMDVTVVDASIFSPFLWKPDFVRLEHLPYVATSARVVAGNLANGVPFMGGADERYGTVIDRPVVLRGRLPKPDAADEIAVPHFADGVLATFHVGDRKTLDLGRRSITVSVVGETVAPGELPPQPQLGWSVLVSPAFIARYRSDVDYAQDGIAMRFAHRTDIESFERDLRAMTGGTVLTPVDQESHTRGVQGSVDLQISALRIFALFMAFTGLLVIGQVLSRETTLASTELPALRALGMARGQLFRLGIIRVVPVAIAGGCAAVGIGWLGSALFPRGAVRLAGPASGLRFDASVLGIGALAVTALTLLVSAWPAWRASRAAAEDGAVRARPSRFAAALARGAAPTPAVAGARLALERGGGGTTVPVLSSLAIVTLGIASFVAAITFGKSLQGMLDRPALYGKTWNSTVNVGDEQAPVEQIAEAIAANPEVDALALADAGAPTRILGGKAGQGPARGIATVALTVSNVKGSLFPAVVEGRPPRGPGEVALGARMIRALGIHIDAAHPPEVRIRLEGGDATATLLVVGRAVVPPLGNFGQLGYGVALSNGNTIAALAGNPGGGSENNDIIVRWRDGADRAAVIKRIQKRFPTVTLGGDLSSGRLADVVNFGGVQSAPVLVGGLLAGLGLTALAHVLVTAVRRHRRDIAILKTIGFVRRQARLTVACQATVTVFVAAVVGMPLGVAGGRWLWRSVAEGLGVLPRQFTPTLVLGVIPLALIGLANLIALWPARTAARTRPALVLRTE